MVLAPCVRSRPAPTVSQHGSIVRLRSSPPRKCGSEREYFLPADNLVRHFVGPQGLFGWLSSLRCRLPRGAISQRVCQCRKKPLKSAPQRRTVSLREDGCRTSCLKPATHSRGAPLRASPGKAMRSMRLLQRPRKYPWIPECRFSAENTVFQWAGLE